VRPLHEVTRLEPPPGAGGRWRVTFRRLDGQAGGTVEAATLVLAAGTLGTPRLLLTNRKRLPRLSPALGTRFSGNGDALGLALDPRAEDVRVVQNQIGPVMTSRLDYTAEGNYMLADGGLPPGFTGILDLARGVNAIRGWRRWLVRARLLLTRAGLTDQPLSPRAVRIDHSTSNEDSLIFLMIGRDAASGRMRLTPLFGRFDIRWSKDDSAALFAAMRETAHAVADAAEATPFFALEAGPLDTFTTVHPLGGCPMGDSPARGVVDDAGRAYGYAGLWILDGSIVPTALGVNPSKTIAALAERGAERLVAETGA
jgi:cholesterol oxidase